MREFHNDETPGTVKYYWENTKENFKREEDVVGRDIRELEDEFLDDIPEEWSDDNFTDFKHHDYMWWFNAVKWIANAIFVATPTMIICLFLLLFNIFENVFWNKIWAHGNIWLVGKTVFMAL